MDLSFDQGLHVITGETGAGKSILIGALQLLLGGRFQKSAVLDETKKCIVKGTFSALSVDLKDLFEDLDVDFEPETVFLREISPSGRSRMYINERPCTIKVAQQIGARLVDMHRQHDTLDLLETPAQFNILDAFSGITDKVKTYQKGYQKWKTLHQKISNEQQLQSERIQKLDYLSFQLDEIQSIHYHSGEYSALEQQVALLDHQERISELSQTLSQAIQNDQHGFLDALREAYNGLQKLGISEGKVQETSSSILELIEQLQELDHSLIDLQSDTIQAENQDEITDRLDFINKLINKHQLNTGDDLIILEQQLEQEINSLQTAESDLEHLLNESKKLESTLIKQAASLSKERNKKKTELIQRTVKQLHELSMMNAKMDITLEPSPTLNLFGQENISILFSANKGAALQSIGQVASGGEMSRFNLALKSVVGKKHVIPTLILDEIDVGVSGDVSLKMGKLMKKLSDNQQVLCITHSAQIAAQGEHHYHVYKQDNEERTFTRVRKLNKKDRVHELAVLLSADPPSTAALDNAAQLLKTEL